MKTIKKANKKMTRFLIISFIVIIVVSISVFTIFTISTNKNSEKAINEVGTIYMSSMSEKIAMHFETTIKLRLAQVGTIIKNIPPETVSYGDYMLNKISSEGKIRSFDYLAFLKSDGEFEMLYGDHIKLNDPQPFFDSLKNDEQKIAIGETESGEKVVMMGIPTDYKMADGKSCIALVAGLPVEYINNILSLNNQSHTLTYSHIIKHDGKYVIRNANAFRDNYFTRIKEVVSELNGKNAQQYVKELNNAIKNEEDYSAILIAEGERRHIYCTPLSYSEWYLVTVMPYGALDETVNELSAQRISTMFIGIGAILIALVTMFAVYFRKTQQQIKELDKTRKEAIHANKAKSEFLSNMSHDIRTPMNAIVGMTAIASANIDNKLQVQNCLKKITLSSKHLLGLINDILDMSKIESGKLTLNIDRISLREVMDSIVNIVQPQIKAKNQHFDVLIRDIETEDVYCDSVRLNQILLNFLSNAIKFTPDGGSICVSLYEESSPKGEKFVRIHIRIKDNGIGMAPEFQKKIFESFTREDNTRVYKTEGTGLGMAITKYIVDAMEGTIEVHSELGVGSEFHVTLDMEKADIQEDMILPDWNMLVVDDDEQLCKSTISSLEAIGVKADWTLDGETAIKMVDKRHKMHDDYQIILLDWKLPGIDGIETARRIQNQLKKDIPILLISAYDWGEIEEDARNAGISGFISKPLFKSTLYYRLKQYTGKALPNVEHNSQNSSDLNGINVLVAEDNDLNWEIAKELLSQLGLNMEHAENGQICFDKFKESSEGYYSAILMDLRMPVMTGYEATEAIRALDRSDSDIPIIAMTADAFSDDRRKCIDCGMNDHVSKPINVDIIAQLLKKYIK